jgi:ribosomal protein L4
MLSIFDGYRVRDLSGEADRKAIEALDDPTRDVLFRCIQACNERDLAEERMVKARSDVKAKENIAIDATNTYDGLKATRDTVTGKEDHGPKAGANLNTALKTKERYAAQQAVIRAQQPGYKPLVDDTIETVTKKIAKLSASHAKLLGMSPLDSAVVTKAATALAHVRVSRDREQGFQRIVSNDFRGS